MQMSSPRTRTLVVTTVVLVALIGAVSALVFLARVQDRQIAELQATVARR